MTTQATRVQIPAYTDRWMMGDRYGEIIRIAKASGGRMYDIAFVSLDISGKTVRVILDDCSEIA